MKRINIYMAVVLTMLALLSTASFSQDKPVDLSGSWLGKIDLGTVELRIVFNIEMSEEGVYSATMDSPDQGAKGIPLGKVTVTDDSLKIEAPALMGEYLGKIISSGTIDGTWTQGGREMELNLELQEQEFQLNRPQEPQPPYPYTEKEVTFENSDAGITFAGTLTIPGGDQLYPAVILITGSGSQNRDEEIFEHKPFKVIADYLTRNGIAVLRYDDRGVSKSGGSAIGATSEDFKDDARAGIDYLMTLDVIDKSRVGVVGHSEGGLIAQLLAAEYDDIAFIVMLAGPGTSGAEVLLDQSEYISLLYNVPDSVISLNTELNSQIYKVITEESDPATGLDRLLKHTEDSLRSKNHDDVLIKEIRNNLSQSFSPASYPWMRYFIMSDPAKILPSVKCPVLALNGSKDCQVLAEKNIGEIKRILTESGNNSVTALVMPGLNHLVSEM